MHSTKAIFKQDDDKRHTEVEEQEETHFEFGIPSMSTVPIDKNEIIIKSYFGF